MSEYPTYLIHYGIQGQKWGVRRFQNEDGTWTPEGLERRNKGLKISDKDALVLPKGTIVNRITINKKEKNKGSKYLYTDVDKDVYEGAFATYQKYKHGKWTRVYKKSFETKKDLIAPSDKKAHEIVENRLKDKKVASEVKTNSARMILNSHPLAVKVLAKNGLEPDSTGFINAFAKSPKEKQEKILKEMEFSTYNWMVETNKKELNNMLKEVSKQGYNAIMDYNNVKQYNKAAEPFIAINAKKTIKEIDTKRLEDKQIEEAMERLKKKNKGEVLL